ncbi:SusD/RagB family nutrient-binding outer membrane lipoprotein [Chitinophaga sp. Cy-1792]|uniref:SusD/RagB family nutrient-binding outer membrane lipoprotein n=1 Tax=Chitinophaga sp. Cy-1792 TaxID=2608339 RepID=UPI001421FAC8|nr:SusD/RagB family nutrient-binding outer membrane lipoprotein [Chitinophaga sp. Cy-1792]NIG57234.1 SusD/RagB family nutrient-binding outer membrane lipoprotein [Chitinophaga sp. Cy-1792]
MKSLYKIGVGAAMLGLSLASCTKGFEDLNQNPQVSPGVAPEMQLILPGKAIVDRDFDWFYDCYQYTMQWMQFGVPAPGASLGRLFSPSNTNDFYATFYKNIGPNLVDIDSTVAKMADANKAKYTNIRAIADIMKAYAAWRVSESNGSIPYTKAFASRYGGTVTPTYDTQDVLLDRLDAELKSAVAGIVSKLPNQQGAGSYDIFYNGNANNWAKAGNVMRLRLAMRVLKRDQAKATAIVNDVLASPAGLFTSIAEEWKFVSGPDAFAKAGNWNMASSVPLVGSKNMIDYMVANKDPRLPLFFEKNGYTQEAFDSLKAGGVFSASATYNGARYVGVPASPDKRKDAAYAGYFAVRSYDMKFGATTVNRKIDTVSYLQMRLFNSEAEYTPAGIYTQPIITYAEQCFILAELAVRGIITGYDAQTQYNNGITASVNTYDEIGRKAGIQDYTALEANAIATYLSSPNVALTGDQAGDLEKIGIQMFLNGFKAPWEAWGSWKLNGVPKVGGILNYEPMVQNAGNEPTTIPRRWALPQPTIAEQVQNWRDAVTEMGKTGQYGKDVNDYTGRVWWDMQ